MTDKTPSEIAADIVATPFAWPGGYERYAITDDGGVLCHQCCKAESDLIAESDPGDGWYVDGCSSAAETDSLTTCCNCSRVIIEDWENA